MYEIVAEFKPSDNTLTGTVKVDFYNGTEAELECIAFQLYANAYRKNPLYSPIPYEALDEAYYAGENYGGIVVSSVLGSVGYEIGGADENILYAQLQSPLPPEGRVTLDIGFSTKLAKLNHRLGVTKSAVNFAGAFPTVCGYSENGFYECVYSDVGEPFFADVADYTVTLTLPKEYRLATCGAVTEEKGLESKKKHTVSVANARDFAFVIAKDYSVLQKKIGKTAVNYYALSAGQDDKNQELLDYICTLVSFYSSAFGEYPFDVLTVAETELIGGVADYSGLCMFSKSLTGVDRIYALAKEIAAEWWYAAVGANRVESAWLVEGLSAYSAALFFEKNTGYDFTKKGLIDGSLKEYLGYKSVYQKALGWVDTRMQRPLSTFLNGYEYGCVSADKAVVMLSELERGIGSKKFMVGLKKYYSENRFGSATPAALVGAFERAGAQASGFFDGYLSGKGTL